VRVKNPFLKNKPPKVGTNMRVGKTVMLNVRLTPQLKEALVALSALERRSATREIEFLIGERCKKLKIRIPSEAEQ